MPSLTAIIHTNNDALRLGRALEMLYPCDEILVVDHASRDKTVHAAREYGAKVIAAQMGALPAHYLPAARSEWILCLDPRESLTEALAASLFEWKTEAVDASVSAFSVFLREETAAGWIENPAAQTRLVPSVWNRWKELLPSNDPRAVALEGQLLRFALP
jgi:cellulose synthase/poly-beta-1,6-N-acetylglucosamine synthase-like glycosyltransferase